MTFSPKKKWVAQSYINDVKLDIVQLVKHLGHIITSDLTDDKDIMHPTSIYNRKAICLKWNKMELVHLEFDAHSSRRHLP